MLPLVNLNKGQSSQRLRHTEYVYYVKTAANADRWRLLWWLTSGLWRYEATFASGFAFASGWGCAFRCDFFGERSQIVHLGAVEAELKAALFGDQ